jgi:hypothetical protein
MTAEGQSDKMASDMELRMKQMCVNEFLCVEKIAPSDIHWCLLNVKGDQTVDVSKYIMAFRRSLLHPVSGSKQSKL